MKVELKTDGHPLDADVELWQDENKIPQKMRVYVEDGHLRPFKVFIETPRGPNTVAVRNTGQMQSPVRASVSADDSSDSLSIAKISDKITGKTIKGGALRAFSFDPSVESVQVLLKTDGRTLNARIEMLQGKTDNIPVEAQVIELYSEDGFERQVFVLVETPGDGSVIRVVNSSTMGSPLSAFVEPYKVDRSDNYSEPLIGDGDLY